LCLDSRPRFCEPRPLRRVSFPSHLHSDHLGDLAAPWAGGWTGGRTTPLEIWGPSGSMEDYKKKYKEDNGVLDIVPEVVK
jgi:ribonuclease BN (tRNA processing enzyme)